MELKERILMLLLIFVVVTKSPGIEIFAALSVISCIWADFFLITFIIVPNITLGTDSLLLIEIFVALDAFWSVTHIFLSWILIH